MTKYYVGNPISLKNTKTGNSWVFFRSPYMGHEFLQHSSYPHYGVKVKYVVFYPARRVK